MLKNLSFALFALLISVQSFAKSNSSAIVITDGLGNPVGAVYNGGVYGNKDAVQSNCKCASFSVVLEGSEGRAGATVVSEVKVTKLASKNSKGKASLVGKLDSFSAMYRCMGSAKYSEQMSIELNGTNSKDMYKIDLLKRKCMNPTMKECRKMISVGSVEVELQELADLSPMTSYEALDDMRSQSASKKTRSCK